MYEWIISVPSDKSEERWLALATCKTMEALTAIVSSLMSTNADGPLIIRVEKRRVMESGK